MCCMIILYDSKPIECLCHIFAAASDVSARTYVIYLSQSVPLHHLAPINDLQLNLQATVNYLD